MARIRIESSPIDNGRSLVYLRRDREIICHGQTADLHGFVERVGRVFGGRFADGPISDDRSLIDLRRAILAELGLPLSRVGEDRKDTTADPGFPLVLVMPEPV